MVGIWQTNEWHIFVCPITSKCGGIVGPDGQDLCTTAGELVIVITQARQLRTAVRSHEAPQESQQHRLAKVSRELDLTAPYVH